MPIYEYLCQDCGRKSSFLVPSAKIPFEPKCPNCGGGHLRKLVSRVAVLRSGEGSEDLGDVLPGGDEDSSGPLEETGEPGGEEDNGGSDLE